MIMMITIYDDDLLMTNMTIMMNMIILKWKWKLCWWEMVSTTALICTLADQLRISQDYDEFEDCYQWDDDDDNS